MQIDFNNVRKQLMREFNSLTKILNSRIDKSDRPGSSDYELVNLHAGDIKDRMDNIRRLIIAVCITYEENNPEFQAIQDINIAEFNRPDWEQNEEDED